jgi:hypothetical protein
MSVNVNPKYKKVDIQPIDRGTDLFFNSLVPVSYRMDNCPCDKRHLSLLPSPKAVLLRSKRGYTSLSGEEGIRIIRKDDEFMRVSEQELIAVLWAKVKQLSERIEALEGQEQEH